MLRSTGSGNWLSLPPEATRTLERMTRNVEPFPKPDLVAVRIGPKMIRNGASSYLKLLDLRTTADIPFSGDSMKVELQSARPSPWTERDELLVYFPKENVLQRETAWIHVPADLAVAVERGGPLDGEAGRTPWLIGLVAVFACALALSAIAVRRVRARTGTRPIGVA